MDAVSFIGCGAVGQVIGRLFREKGVFEIRDILNRSPESSRAAAAFIGAGRPVADLASMGPADLFIVAASDDSISGCAHALAGSGLVRKGTVVCHLSGALSSEVLAPAREAGALVASVHPVKSFADRALSASGFAGTWCGIEGDEAAVAVLTDAFLAIGARTFGVDTRFKTIYHAGSVLVCNYLTSLLEAGTLAYEKGGLPRETALQVMEPLVRGTVDNIFRAGTERALTGPIARGDAAVVSRQVAALQEWNPDVAEVYAALGRIAVDLSRRRGTASAADLALIRAVLDGLLRPEGGSEA